MSLLCFVAQPKGPCWFCLGSAEVEKHLVVSVSNNVSVTSHPVDSYIMYIAGILTKWRFLVNYQEFSFIYALWVISIYL